MLSTLSSLTEAGEKWQEKHVIGDEQEEVCQKARQQTRHSPLEGQPCSSWTDLELRCKPRMPSMHEGLGSILSTMETRHEGACLEPLYS